MLFFFLMGIGQGERHGILEENWERLLWTCYKKGFRPLCCFGNCPRLVVSMSSGVRTCVELCVSVDLIGYVG